MNNGLLQSIPKHVPDLDPQAVLAVGAAGLENSFSGDTLAGVRLAWVDGLRGAWALGIALFGAAFLTAFMAKWPGSMVPVQPEKYEGQSSNGEDKSATPEEV